MMLMTPLYDCFSELGARMVEFAGYQMPVQFPDGIINEHRHTRSHAGLFDVSHMGQILVRGADAACALERLMPADLQRLMPGQQVYSLLTNTAGGVIDDLIVTRWSDELFSLVVNAGCKHDDFRHLQSHLPMLELSMRDDQALLALQGPEAVRVLGAMIPEAPRLLFMQAMHFSFEAKDCTVSRSGYTGEDGFEITVPASHAEAFARKLLADPMVKPVGLGARDSLRLEAGLCLYGHELSASITPLEAGLKWAIAPTRRPGAERAGGYPGAQVIETQWASGPSRRRVGLIGAGKAPVREGAVLMDQQGREVGVVSSGGYAPSLDASIAMAYVECGSVIDGASFDAMVRGKPRPMTLSSLPFVKPRYYRG